MSFAAPSRTSTSPQPVVIWNPYTILGIECDSRCVGATSKNRKCRTSLAYANVNDMQKLLRKLSTRQPDPGALEPMLSRIAGYALCRNKRNKHQEQSISIVENWKTKILEAYPDGVVEAADLAAHDAAAPASDAHSNRASPAVDDIDFETLRLIRQVLQGLDDLSTRSNSRQSSEIPIPTTEIHHGSNSTLSSRIASPAPTNRRSASSHTLSLHSHDEHNSCPLGLTHESRRALDEECPICRELASDLSELTWCKAGCGRSMHRDCVELWRASRMEAWLEHDDMDIEAVFRCALCRTEWVDCDCEA